MEYLSFKNVNFNYFTKDGEFEVNEGDITHTAQGTPHGSKSGEEQNIDYIWIELATNGYLPITYDV